MSTLTAPRPVARFRNPESGKKARRGNDAKPKRDPLPDARIQEWLAERTPEQLNKLQQIVKQSTRLAGYSQCREGGAVWEKCKREVLEDLIAHEVDLDELEVEEK